MFRKKIAMLLALSTVLASSVGVINVNAETPEPPTESVKPSVVDVLNLKSYLFSDNTEYVAEYDYNSDNSIDYLDMLLLKKDVLEVATPQEAVNTPTMTSIQDIDELSTAMQENILDFSIDVFKQQVAEGENTIVSPESLYLALGMTVNGANGTTLQELKDTLFKDVSMDEFNNSVAYLVNGNDSDVCKVANSIWVREDDGLVLNEDFKDYSEQYFNSEVRTQAFDGILVKDVNEWVSSHTDGMIKEILDSEPDSDVLMYLINAICFTGTWEQEYDEYHILENRTFTDYTGNEQKVNMLSSNEDVYISDDDATGFLKYYDGGRYAFMGILPNEDISVEDYVNSLTSEKFSYLYNNRRYSSDTLNISVKIPEFKVEGDYNLKDTLQNMGITTAFTDGADFSNMLNVPNKISKVRQKAFLQLDRNGTKAAAVTIITDEAGMPETPVEMEYLRVYLDRPFAYAIVDTQTGLPIFMGVVNSVESPELD
jgi:serpin B